MSNGREEIGMYERFSLAVMGLAIAACGAGSDLPSPPLVPPSEARAERAGPGSSTVTVGDRLRDLCNLPTPRFRFDRADVGAEARAALDALAQCFVDGPAKQSSMRLIGHADPRGTVTYNFALGQQRAGSVASYLAGRGVPEERMTATSRGELDASGSDEGGWQVDRRVEVVLAE
jgi:peptidoglycan-associated lipoprotein